MVAIREPTAIGPISRQLLEVPVLECQFHVRINILYDYIISVRGVEGSGTAAWIQCFQQSYIGNGPVRVMHI